MVKDSIAKRKRRRQLRCVLIVQIPLVIAEAERCVIGIKSADKLAVQIYVQNLFFWMIFHIGQYHFLVEETDTPSVRSTRRTLPNCTVCLPFSRSTMNLRPVPAIPAKSSWLSFWSFRTFRTILPKSSVFLIQVFIFSYRSVSLYLVSMQKSTNWYRSNTKNIFCSSFHQMCPFGIIIQFLTEKPTDWRRSNAKGIM